MDGWGYSTHSVFVTVGEQSEEAMKMGTMDSLHDRCTAEGC